MKTLYKAGYLIKVTSWENDADNYNTKEMQVETEDDAKALVKFCWLFTSKNNRTDRGIGNFYEPGLSQISEINSAFYDFHQEHPGFKGTFFDEPLNLDGIEDEDEQIDALRDYYIDIAYDLGLSCGEYYTRVCDKVEVLYFSQDVLCEDLTSEFKKTK